MSRGRDLSKTLDDKEVRRLRTLLQDNPQIEEQPEMGGEYPKVLYGPKYHEAEQNWRTNPDPLQKKTYREVMQTQYLLVYDLDEETDLLEEGWKPSPVDHLPIEKDPRIPRGREAKRAAESRRLSVHEEVRQLERRLALLRAELPEEPIAAAPAKPSTKKLHGVRPAPPRPGRTAAAHAPA